MFRYHSSHHPDSRSVPIKVTELMKGVYHPILVDDEYTADLLRGFALMEGHDIEVFIRGIHGRPVEIPWTYVTYVVTSK